MPVTLGELFTGIPCHGLTAAYQTLPVRAIVTDSRLAEWGSLFVALQGQKTNGILFAQDAVTRGAVAILADHTPADARLPTLAHVPWIAAPHVRSLLPRLAARLYGFPAHQLRLHAVTGTNGKTTTAMMLAHILAVQGQRVAFWTTNSVNGGASSFRPHMTTPEAPELHQYLRDVQEHGAQDTVIEVSSHALQLERIGGLTFETGAITNITPDHLDFHGSFQAYLQAKSSLMQYIAPHGLIALNADDPNVAALAAKTGVAASRFGLGSRTDVRAQIDELGVGFSRWRWFYQNHEYGKIALPIPGQHNVMNALCALTMALHLKIDPELASQALESFVPAPRRLETVQVGPFTIISDVAMNRGSYDAVMQSITALKKPVIVVNAIRGNRGVAINQDIAHVLADWNERLDFAPVVLTRSDQYIRGLPVDYRVRAEECQAFLDTAQTRRLSVDLQNELPDALDAAIDRLRPGGVLLLLGTFGMDDGLTLAKAKLSHLEP